MLMKGILGILVILGLVMPVVPAVSVGRLTRAAMQPATSRHPMVKAMVGKFNACYRLKQPVNNVDSFVDKYVYNQKIGGYFLSTWMRISGQPARALLILCGIMLITGYQPLGGQVEELSTLWIGLGISGLLITWDQLLQTPAKWELAVRELRDYLGNSLQPKLVQEYGVSTEEYTEREQEMLREWDLQIPRAVRQNSGRIPHTPQEPSKPTVQMSPEQAAEALQKELAAAREENLITENEYNVIEEIMRDYLE